MPLPSVDSGSSSEWPATQTWFFLHSCKISCGKQTGSIFSLTYTCCCKSPFFLFLVEVGESFTWSTSADPRLVQCRVLFANTAVPACKTSAQLLEAQEKNRKGPKRQHQYHHLSNKYTLPGLADAIYFNDAVSNMDFLLCDGMSKWKEKVPLQYRIPLYKILDSAQFFHSATAHHWDIRGQGDVSTMKTTHAVGLDHENT